MLTPAGAVEACQKFIDVRSGTENYVIVKPPSPLLPPQQERECDAAVNKAKESDLVKTVWQQFGPECEPPPIVCRCCEWYEKNGEVVGKRFGSYNPNPVMRDVTVCWNNYMNPQGPQQSLDRGLAHELTHALQKCKNYPGGCGGSLKKEIEARICANDCRGFDDCLMQALQSSCGKHCMKAYEVATEFAGIRAWYQNKEKKGKKSGGFCQFYPIAPIPPTPTPKEL